MFQRLQTVKKAEILCGIHIPQENAVKLTEDELLEYHSKHVRNVSTLIQIIIALIV